MNDPSKLWESLQRTAGLPDSEVEVYFDENGDVEFEMDLEVFLQTLKDWSQEDEQ